jgi:hypothetical protein
MKKLFLVCLMMLAGSAWAEWVLYTETQTATFYYDPATISKISDGSMRRRVWQLTDLRKRDKDGAMSRLSRVEYDCKQESYRFLTFSAHSEPMTSGTVLKTEDEEDNLKAIPPNTVLEMILNIVCAK